MPRYKFLLCALSISIFSCQPLLQGIATPLSQNPKKAADSTAKPKNEHPGVAVDEDDKSRTSERPLREKAKLILSLLSQEARQWENKDVAAGLQAQIADLLWESDAAAARDILVNAWETALSVNDKKRGRSAYRNYSERVGVMRQVMLVARKRDEALAEKWIEEMADEKEEEKQSAEGKEQRGVFDDRSARSSVLLEAAMAMVKENPRIAASLAIDSLRDGISFGLQNVLIALQAESRELSESVFRAALNRLRVMGMIDPGELLILSSYLYSPGKVKAVGTGDQQNKFSLSVNKSSPKVAPAAQLNPALAAEFLHVAADLLLSAPAPSATPDPVITARAQASVISWLIDRVEQVAPEKAAALANRRQFLVADAQYSLSPSKPPAGHIETQPGENLAEYNARRVDALEKQAESETSPLRRDIAFAEAAVATEPDDHERGRRLASKIKNKQFRTDVANWITYRATLHFIRKDNLALAAELNNQNEDQAQRAVCFVSGAQKLLVAKDNLRADDWLREAATLMRKAEPDREWAKIGLGLVSAYGKFDRSAAAQALRDVVNVMNRFPDNAVYDDKGPAVQRFSGVGASDLSYDARGFGLEAALAVFRAEDFDRVYTALNDLENPEARGTAKLALCKQILREDKSKIPPEKKQPENSTPNKAK